MIHREQVLRFLQEKQETEGGYTGTDLTRLAEILQVTSRGLNKRISFWIKTDKEFKQLIYLGKEKPPITLFEFFKIEQGLESNPIQVKKAMYNDIQEERKTRDQEPLAKTTFIGVSIKKSSRCIAQKHTTGSKPKKSHSLKTIPSRKIVNP